MSTPTRYALIGAGSRAAMYLDAIAGPHADVSQLVAAADTNPGRLEHSLAIPGREKLAQAARVDSTPDAIAAAIADHQVDRVIITSPDSTHADLIATVLQAGADAVVEKPVFTTQLGTQEGHCRRGHR